MSLTIYRRHSADCPSHQLPLSAREKRFYRSCDCPVWISGTTATERYPRTSLNTRDWGVAEARVRAIQNDIRSFVDNGPTLKDCITRFLDSHDDSVSPSTINYYKLTLERLQTYIDSKNKIFIRELTIDLIEDFKTYGLPTITKNSTRRVLVAHLKFFLREAHRRGWITEALAEKIRVVRGDSEQKQPYTDEEINVILSAVAAYPPTDSGYFSKPTTFHLLLKLMLETGMRVSDAIRFDLARCTFVRPFWKYTFNIKKSRRIEKPRIGTVYLSTDLKSEIDSCDWFSPTYPFAYEAFGDDTRNMEQAVYHRMQAIGEKCGVEDCRPHRLRDTFAVRMLVKGIPLGDVSELLGHSSIATTEKYYAAWVPDRKARLERVLHQALMEPVGS